MLQKINLLTLMVFLIGAFSFSQERIGSFKNDLKKSPSFIKEVIPIPNSKNNDGAVFFADAKNIYGYKLNSSFNVSSRITSEEKRRKYKTLLGYNIIDENYKIILTNNNENKFLIVDFSFSDKSAQTKEFVLDSPEEKIIQSVSVNNEFYLITARPYSNYNKKDGTYKKDSEINFNHDVIYFYSINEDNSLSKKAINLSEFEFINKKGNRVKARSLLFPSLKTSKIPKIDASISNPIDITAETAKLYVDGKRLTFSFDKNNKFVQVLEINLTDFSTKKYTFQKNLEKAKRSNSFFIDDKVCIASGNKKELLIEILDRRTKKVIKTFNLYEDREITIKNSPIVQRGGAYSNYRELKTTKQFLRKITTDKFGITVLKVKDTYELSIGGYTPQARGSGMMMGGFGGMPIGTIGGVSMFFNPTMFAYNTSSGTKSTQIDCLFNLNFEHIKGEISENTFDDIGDFLDRNNAFSRKKSSTNKYLFREDNNDITEVFKLKNQTILGSYDKSSKTYYFYKFE